MTMHEVPLAEQSSVFARVKVRHLLGWILGALPVVAGVIALTDSELILTVAVFGFVYGVPLLWWFIRARRKGLVLSRLFGTRPKSMRWVLYVLLNVPVFLFSIGSVIFMYGLISYFAPHFVEQLLSRDPGEQKFLVQAPVLATVFNLAGSLVIAPLFEELIFRGFLLHRFAQKWGTLKAIFVVSLLFGLLHVNFFGAGVFSLVLCAVYIYTGSIWPSVLLHFMNNILSTWPTDGGDGQLMAGDLQGAVWVGLAMVALSAAPLIWFLKKHWPSKTSVLPYYRM